MEDDLSEEVQFHLQNEIEKNVRLGMRPEEARYAALRDFGGVDQVRDQCRDIRSARVLQGFWQDVRYGFRLLKKNPGFTAVAVITLALGIGANTAIFSSVNAVLLKPLPYERPERLFLLWERFSRLGLDRVVVSASEFSDYRDQATGFEQIAAFDYASFNLTGGGEPERIQGAVVSASLFPLLGVKPLLGRTLRPEENNPGQDDVAVLSHGLWQRRFGSDTAAVGKRILLNGRSFTIVGVMPKEFKFPLPLFNVVGGEFVEAADLWLPVIFSERQLKVRGSRAYGVIVRLKPGVSQTQAQAELDVLTNRFARQFPEAYPENIGFGARLYSLKEQASGSIRRPLLVLLASVGCVLLIACVNVASLLLARSSARQREVAIRAALGAERLRLIRQFLIESFLLAFIGGALGLLLAFLSVDFIIALGAATVPRFKEIKLDLWVFCFTFAASTMTGILCGLAPALQIATPDVSARLKEAGRSLTEGPGHSRLRSILVVSEIALALVLLICAGLLIQSFLRLHDVHPGFNPRGVLTMELSPPTSTYPSGRSVSAFFQQVVKHLETVPEVRSAGLVSILPLSGSNNDDFFFIEGRVSRDPADIPDEELRVIAGDYFQAMEIPLLTGRYFTAADSEEAPRVVIINQALARRYWPGEKALGKRITKGDPQANPRWFTVVGVVGNVKHQGLDVEVKPEFYFPHAQYPQSSMIITVRSVSDPRRMTAAIRQAIRNVDKEQSVANVRTLDEVISDSVAPRRLSAVLLGLFSAVALTLASIGIYGVLSCLVTQRNHEIGVRMALGAQRKDILNLIVGRGLRLSLLGAAVGVAVSLVLTRFLEGMLFGVGQTDPPTFVGVCLILVGVSLLACFLPAHRAAKVDPMVALRCE
jgi:putative ABC transport system permease protein